MADYRTSLTIAAPPEIVFTLLTTEAGMASWMGQWAELDPTPGGVFAVDIAGFPARGTYLRVDPPRHVTVSWGFAGNDSLPPGASAVSFDLTATATGTRLDLHHYDLPDDQAPGHRAGWAHFTDRLRRVAGGEHLERDTWHPTESPPHTLNERTTP